MCDCGCPGLPLVEALDPSKRKAGGMNPEEREQLQAVQKRMDYLVRDHETTGEMTEGWRDVQHMIGVLIGHVVTEPRRQQNEARCPHRIAAQDNGIRPPDPPDWCVLPRHHDGGHRMWSGARHG